MNILFSHSRTLRPLRNFAVAFGFAILLSGCQSVGTDGLVTSNAPPEISGPAASAIAGDMVSRLAEQIGPGKATVELKADASPFGQALEAALKGWGYAVVTDQKTDSGATVIPLAYVILTVDGQVLARLSTNSVELGRAYSVTASGATPASALSLMRRG
ncbi:MULTISPECIES: conjugal transfer protein TrbH [Rhizobium/Agrobacterium group]|uniref:conjugal transfer protein TrbH n=1 Tax=Rhizobium/Agrobacterium group TaxID=227290 RepID=UPI0008DBFB48|nr:MULTISPECIES: conjugal transfer protein TrbH [Rhizobium/Agrobacterium group]MCF1436872.1 conjugal transfer protein TrbH [Allorhizobium ampelinum]MCF1464429.1 conjugal transfer protein TrbH [Allorhizobium ampelinum]MCF1496253.1 conjugal transfer protein TrbH [Allorhizobium ampelinum]MUO92374.1 conjugal transfer protein TrbH [Agrobacterium vitis]MUZ54234.1 conjugal transfer protein TrbH [Agrobacterium vitis]